MRKGIGIRYNGNEGAEPGISTHVEISSPFAVQLEFHHEADPFLSEPTRVRDIG